MTKKANYRCLEGALGSRQLPVCAIPVPLKINLNINFKITEKD